MRNVMKAATLESKFPILSVEHDCIISKDADITVCYRVELPELFTVTQAEYEALIPRLDMCKMCESLCQNLIDI